MRRYSILLLAVLFGTTLSGCGTGPTKVEPVTLTPEEERKLEQSLDQAAQQEAKPEQKQKEPIKEQGGKKAK